MKWQPILSWRRIMIQIILMMIIIIITILVLLYMGTK